MSSLRLHSLDLCCFIFVTNWQYLKSNLLLLGRCVQEGMPGSVRLRDNKILQRIMVRQAEEKRLYGAICAAPAVVLMPWGLHKGRKITCHPSFIGDLPTFRAVESNVQVSGELTTSRGPGTVFQFALSFVEQLFGPHSVEDVDSTLIDAGLERSTEVNRVEWPFDHKPQGNKACLTNGCLKHFS